MGSAVAAGLRAAGHRVVAVCGPRPPDGQTAVADILGEAGVAVYEVGDFNHTLHLGLVRRLRKIIRQERVDYVVTFFVTTDTRHVGVALAGLGIPLIASVQNEIQFLGRPLMRGVKSAGFGVVYRRCVDRALCTSSRIRDDLVRRYRFPVDRLEVLTNGVDTGRALALSDLEREGVRKELGVATGEILLLNVGRIDEQKGQLVLLEAIEPLVAKGRQFKLCLVGDVTAGHAESMAYLARAQEFVRRHGLESRVKFLGWRNDVLRLNAACDGYVHSALWEGFPLAVVEAMASGCPVITTDCMGWPPGFVEGKHGFVVPTGDAMALRSAIESLLGLTPAQRAALGGNAQELARDQYDIRRIQERFVSVCEAEVQRSRQEAN